MCVLIKGIPDFVFSAKGMYVEKTQGLYKCMMAGVLEEGFMRVN